MVSFLFFCNYSMILVVFSVKERAYSFWNYILQNINDFKNPLYRPQSSYATEVLLPTINPHTLR